MRYQDMAAADIYDEVIVECVFNEWTPALVAEIKPSTGERVLDLACGTGAVTREVAAIVGPAGSVVAVDLNPAMLDVARRRQPADGGAAVEWHEASAERLPIGDDDVDGVVCQQGFQFFPDRAAAAAEVARVLRPGGRLALSVWCGLDRNPVQERFNESLVQQVGVPILLLPFSLGDASEVEALLAAAGLDAVRVEAQTRTARFDSVRAFVEATIFGVAGIIPALAELDDEQRAGLVERSIDDLAPLADRYTSNDAFRFPMTSLVATAVKP